MPTIQTSEPGRPSLLPVKFEDGPLFGNTNWDVAWQEIDLRDELAVPQGQNDQIYRVVAIEDAEVLLDFVRTE